MNYETGSDTNESMAASGPLPDRLSNENGRIPFSEAASQLQTEPHLLWRWSQRFALFLGPDVAGDHPHYSPADIETLRTIQTLTAEDDLNDQQIAQRLALKQAQQDEQAAAESQFQRPKSRAPAS